MGTDPALTHGRRCGQGKSKLTDWMNGKPPADHSCVSLEIFQYHFQYDTCFSTITKMKLTYFAGFQHVVLQNLNKIFAQIKSIVKF